MFKNWKWYDYLGGPVGAGIAGAIKGDGFWKHAGRGAILPGIAGGIALGGAGLAALGGGAAAAGAGAAGAGAATAGTAAGAATAGAGATTAGTAAGGAGLGSMLMKAAPFAKAGLSMFGGHGQQQDPNQLVSMGYGGFQPQPLIQPMTPGSMQQVVPQIISQRQRQPFQAGGGYYG